MIRFEIQELLNQSDWGVTYLAYDKQDQRDVALRRYMPLGRDGALNEQQIREYDQRCIRLSRIEHPNLRAVVQGSVDRIDTTPYLATEWVDGKPLDELLEGEKLDAPTAMDLAKSALKVSLILSKTFGEEAIWVDTDPNSIIVGSEGSDRGFTFWVCLSRWFGVQPGERRVATVATMIEKLVGWDTQVYSSDSGGGFGGWVKKVKGSPDIGVQEALDALEEISGGKSKRSSQKRTKKWLVTPPPSPRRAKARPSPSPASAAAAPKTLSSQASPFLAPPRGVKPLQPVQSPGGAQMNLPPRMVTPTQQLPAPTLPSAPASSSSSGSSMPMVVAIACIACLVGIAYLVKHNQDRMLEQLANNPQAGSAINGDLSDGNPAGTQIAPRETAAAVVSRPDDGTSKPNQPSEPIEPKPAKPPEPNVPKPAAGVLSPEDVDKIMNTGNGAPVKLQGKLTDIGGTNKKGVLVMYFNDLKGQDHVRGLADAEEFDGGLNYELLESYVGKVILLEGRCKHMSGRFMPHVVEITSLDQISVVGQNSAKPQKSDPVPADDPADQAKPGENGETAEPEPQVSDDGLPVFSCDEKNEIRKFVGKKVVLKGRLTEVQGGDQDVITLTFKPSTKNNTRIYGRAEKESFKGNFTDELFREYIGKEILIEGTFMIRGNWGRNSHFVEFTRPSQVRLSED